MGVITGSYEVTERGQVQHVLRDVAADESRQEHSHEVGSGMGHAAVPEAQARVSL